MLSLCIQFLGSVRLAVPLLGVIALILIGATILEPQIGTATVQQNIYKSAWFGALMFLLAMNLAVSTLQRYPWRGARKIGFALTHFGLIVIIAGSAAVIHLNTEGMLLVRSDSFPRNEIRLEGDLLDVVTPDQTHLQQDLFLKADGSVFPQQVGEVKLLGYSDQVQNKTSFVETDAVANPAVELSIHSDRMGQDVSQWLAAAPSDYQSVELGPATLELVQMSDRQALDKQLHPAPQSKVGSMGELSVRQGRQTLHWDLEKILNHPQVLKGGMKLTVKSVWPDFRLDETGEPTTASAQFRNPALQLSLRQGDQEEQWYVFGDETFPTMRSASNLPFSTEAIAYHPPSSVPANFFRVMVMPDQSLYYAAQSSQGFQSGSLRIGEAIAPGWADFEITATQFLPHGKLQRSIEPVMTAVNERENGSPSNPALHISTPDGKDYWLPWGEPQTLGNEANPYFIAFSPKILQLPFQVQLNDFIVERNEGSESVAMWTSDLTLRSDTGQTLQRRVWMNHPTWFKGWKLAQASWNPGDLSQSTLQLKREPWWVTGLTWLGSLLVVGGIATMFYGRSLTQKLQTTAQRIPAVSSTITPLPAQKSL